MENSGTAEKQEEQNKLITSLNEKVQALSSSIEKSQIADYLLLLQRPKRLIFLNLLSGIARGVGIAVGITIFTSSAVYILQLIGALNIPIIGDYIADVVQHVQKHLENEVIRY